MCATELELLTPLDLGQGIMPLVVAGDAWMEVNGVRVHKVGYFLPASGQATRMFAGLAQAVQGGDAHKEVLQAEPIASFFKHIKQLPFEVLATDDRLAQLKALLRTYAGRPKALLPWCRYGDLVALCWEEHLAEFISYFTDSTNLDLRFHLTIRPIFETVMAHAVAHALAASKKHSVHVSYSFQSLDTDYVAQDVHTQQSLVDDQGAVVRYPSGHGAVLPSLQQLANEGVELAFIKNIDNVQSATQRAVHVVPVQRAMGHMLLEIVARVHKLIGVLQAGGDVDFTAQAITRAYALLAGTFYQHNLPRFEGDIVQQRAYLLQRLWRPLRLCGVQQTDARVGGAPFLCQDPTGMAQSPQLVEYAQVQGTEQESIFTQARYINCAMLVCWLQDPAGVPFTLADFVDNRTCFVTQKVYQGRDVLVTERPGLWNGSMSGWNSAFVALPSKVFAPVKAVTDLVTVL